MLEVSKITKSQNIDCDLSDLVEQMLDDAFDEGFDSGEVVNMDNGEFKMEIVYTCPYSTEEDIKKAQDLRQELYEKYNSVQVYPNGLHEVRIVASDTDNYFVSAFKN